MENLLNYCNAANEEFQGMVNEREKHENQMIILMDLLKIPKEERNFEGLRDRIEKMIEENYNLTTYIQSKNDDGQSSMARETSPMEKILNNPGLVHLAENIFGNLDDEYLEVCGQLNESSKQILANPNFWLRKFTALSKENQKDWIKVIQSVKNSDKGIAIISYLQWNLKKEALVDLPCYSRPDVQDDFKKRIRESCKKEVLSDEDTEIVKFLAPLTDNPNAPDNDGKTPSSITKNAEIYRILKSLKINTTI